MKAPSRTIALAAMSLFLLLVLAGVWQFRAYRSRQSQIESKAAQLLLRAQQGDAVSEYELGRMFFAGQGVRKSADDALLWYRKSASQGNANAQYSIGSLYYYGRGVEQSDTEALAWYRQAAAQNLPVAQYALGMLYYHGRGLPQDNAQAAIWYRKAADQNFPKAEYDLGYLYEFGYGVPRDLSAAHIWFQRAADSGDPKAQFALGLRMPRLSKFAFALQLLTVFGAIVLMVGFFKPSPLLGIIENRILAISGLLLLLNQAASFWAHSPWCLFPFAWTVSVYRFVYFFVNGVCLGFIFQTLFPRTRKSIVYGAILIAFSITLLFAAVAHFQIAILAERLNRLIVVNALPLGILAASLAARWIPVSPPERESEPSDEIDAIDSVDEDGI